MDRVTEHRFRNHLNQLVLQAMALNCEAQSDAERLRQLEQIEAVELTIQQLSESFKMQLDPDWLESRVRVLVVEDDACQRNSIVNGLQNAGLFVAQAADGSSAVNYVHHSIPPDVVLMDIEMPTCDGAEANALINHIPLGGRVKVIAVTAKNPEHLDLASFDGYLQKPFQMKTLVDKIKEVVQDLDQSCDEIEKKVLAK